MRWLLNESHFPQRLISFLERNIFFWFQLAVAQCSRKVNTDHMSLRSYLHICSHMVPCITASQKDPEQDFGKQTGKICQVLICQASCFLPDFRNMRTWRKISKRSWLDQLHHLPGQLYIQSFWNSQTWSIAIVILHTCFKLKLLPSSQGSIWHKTHP